ncbi:uncharacterized protein LOC129568295 isoform X2 [Sitodiplosis mosellana]|uniref:uncharacterized protein LOC129568295 isoform X2 n=1 Tax=Sitodiplosis mosellana TaxID=263140 RepID=UPI002443CA5C|nr:uncharacterized protein LOC129568295 isoform X2 [Sitodiplosis mosellana]
MGIKDLDALAKTIKPFRHDICQNSWSNNGEEAGSSADTTDLSPSQNHSNNQRQRTKRPDRAVYIPRGRRNQTLPPTAQIFNSGVASKTEVFDRETTNVITSSNLASSPNQNSATFELKHRDLVIDTKGLILHDEITAEPNSKPQSPIAIQAEKAQLQKINTISNMAETNINIKCEGNKIEGALNTSDKDYNEEREFQRASKEINRRNRRIIKQTFDSDVLEINETPSVISKQSPPETESKLEKKTISPHAEAQSNADSTTQTKRTEVCEKKTATSETDDWESMFDDNGECLDPKVMNEITASVGKVSITKPKNDYKSYEEPINLDEEEFPHVLEISNFPVEFKTQDLMMIFCEYKDSGFDIKWVDDTHALVVFSSSKIAARALNTGHPFIKLKPLTQATAESRARAKKSALFLQPYRQRPETCAALARRLVTGALGVRLSTAREEREIERRVLKEAKERKLLAAKLRDEAWEN